MTIQCVDAIEFLKQIRDKSVNMILCDLPYGITACKWDTIIPFEPLWEQYKRIIKDNGTIVLTASQPFTTELINSNKEWFKYEWIWAKSRVVGFLNAKRQPLRTHENVLVFYDKQPTYNPQGITKSKIHRNKISSTKPSVYNEINRKAYDREYDNYPRSVIHIPNPNNYTWHPTQKPLELFKYLIKTYTNEGDMVVDNCVGSGTTAVACKILKRKFMCCDNNQEYVDKANERLSKAGGLMNYMTEKEMGL